MLFAVVLVTLRYFHSKIETSLMIFCMQAQFSQMRPTMAPPVAARMPMYPPGASGLGQVFYGQGPPTIIPPQVMIRFSFAFLCVILSFF